MSRHLFTCLSFSTKAKLSESEQDIKTIIVTWNTAFEIHLNFVALELRLVSDIIIQQSLYVRMQSQACCDYLTVNVKTKGNWIVQTPCTYHYLKFAGAVSWAFIKLKGCYYIYIEPQWLWTFELNFFCFCFLHRKLNCSQLNGPVASAVLTLVFSMNTAMSTFKICLLDSFAYFNNGMFCHCNKMLLQYNTVSTNQHSLKQWQYPSITFLPCVL